jgi:Cu+-exporting ATPase
VCPLPSPDNSFTAIDIVNRRKEEAMVHDPVCQMEVNEQSAEAQSKFQGQTYYFCSQECKDKFDKNPGEYARKSA